MADISQLAIGGVSVAVLIGICVQIIKSIPDDNQRIKRYLPFISAGLGALLGLLASNFVFPDIIAFIVVGAGLGLTASGGYDAITALKKPEDVQG